MIDVLIIGAGHAGVEAACAAARRGARVTIATFAHSDTGRMSCNPSIGGVGKGHLVREIDALGGVMARAADRSAIHHRMLNASKGSAVRGPRVQADRRRFAAAINALVCEAGVGIIECSIGSLVIEGGRCVGARTDDGQTLTARTVVLATGTFLGATLYRGRERWSGGRVGADSAHALAGQLGELGLADGVLKTGTPPRLDGRTIDWSRVAPQASDPRPWTLALEPLANPLPQLGCAITRTNPHTHDIIRAGFDLSPLFSGSIEGRGPRYCPSIEDKVTRFGDRDGHQIFLEPEGLEDHIVYPNGISTSLSADTQQAMIHSIEGLEQASVVEPGYAVEYRFADPRRLSQTLEHRDVGGLFFAGQLNGTTGYEEAAAQGLIAGANAVAIALDLAPVTLDRATSYIGVMIDDLTLQGVSEPYRMLTARSEYRLHLRADNAVSRLGPLALDANLLDDAQRTRVINHLESVREAHSAFDQRLTGSEVGLEDPRQLKHSEWLLRDDVAESARRVSHDSPAILEAIDDLVYAPYLERQQRELAARRRDGLVTINTAFEYGCVPGLSTEMLERLQASRPANLDEASRLPGVTPAALTALHFALVKAA